MILRKMFLPSSFGYAQDEAKDVNGQAFIVGGSGVWWMRSWSHIKHIKLNAKTLYQPD